MPYVMQHETWMKLTEVSFKPRSKYLKSIDAALKRYHQTKSDQELKSLKLALHHWKMSKGFDGDAKMPAWKTSERNRNKAVETLDAQVFGFQDPHAMGLLAELAELPFYGMEAFAEGAAREAMKQAREEALTELLMGKQMVIRKAGLAVTLYFIKKKVDKVNANASKAASAASAAVTGPIKEAARKAVKEMLRELLSDFPLEVVQEAMKAVADLMPDFIGEVAGAVAPYLSVATSGTKALVKTGQAVKQEFAWIEAGEHLAGFGKGDPAAAAEAIRRMIERDRNQSARLAGIYATDATVKAAAIAADAASFGAPTVSAVVTPLQGMATALAVLSLQLFLVCRDFHEKHKANKVLMDRKQIRLSPAVFEAHPLTGCYFVACSNTSDIINFLVEDIGATGWMFDVEVLAKQHVHPMQKTARQYIADARFEIEGLEHSMGNVEVGGIMRFHKSQKNKLINKVKSALPFIDNPKDYEGFAHKIQKQEVVSRDVLKSRIQGIGPRKP